MVAVAEFQNVAPGDWISTGWGAQHKVREVLDAHVVLACHGPADDQRAEQARVKLGAGEEQRCSSCERVNGLGPMVPGVLGEVRRTPEGWVGICVAEHQWHKWVLLNPAPERWAPDWFMANATRLGSLDDLGGA